MSVESINFFFFPSSLPESRPINDLLPFPFLQFSLSKMVVTFQERRGVLLPRRKIDASERESCVQKQERLYFLGGLYFSRSSIYPYTARSSDLLLSIGTFRRRINQATIVDSRNFDYFKFC